MKYHQNEPRQILEWDVQNYDLNATLASGQSFCWRKTPSDPSKTPLIWKGWIHQIPCQLYQIHSKIICQSSPSLQESQAREFLQIDEPIEKIRNSFPPNDPWIQKSIEFCPGIRILKNPIWETVAMFICSAMKQVRHIEQMNDALRLQIGTRVGETYFQFPTPQQIAACTESQLRACGLGFRAPHLLKTAQQITNQEVNLEVLFSKSTQEAREILMTLQGVGEKVANCILLYGYHRLEVVPIDVWIERVLKRLYLKKKRALTRSKLQTFADEYWGPYAGYAQQYLFHWVRITKGKELP